MRIVFFGTSDFAVPALRAMADHVVLVVSQPDRPSGRGMQLRATPVKQAAIELGLPVEAPEKARNPEFVSMIRDFNADFLLVAAYGQILSLDLLNSARNGGINLHGSILPDYRGAAPIQRAIQDGKTETGVTLMQMDKGMDTGDSIAVAKVPILPDQTAGELFEILANSAAELIKDWAPRIASGDYPRTPQDLTAGSHAAKITKEECELQFEGDAQQEYNRYRAVSPFPGAFLMIGDQPMKLKEVRLGVSSAKPGEVIAVSPNLEIGFGTGSLLLHRVQPAGKKEVTGAEFANGMRLKVGDQIGRNI